ncbi:glutathione S-transferase [Heliocybe sulcata]|uniref:glutathione transferase n=1 Tax=Heliocybe sulcata TaxID=5364 RepID=A0A5C3MM63_9AGAM|nr:glutathione S-transferase [Heliocybe sulcata]
MVLKLYGHTVSSATKRVACIANELKVPYELVTIDLFSGEHKWAAALEKQPFGELPWIDDGGFVLYESRAICRYLVAKYGPSSSLVPKDLTGNAKFEQAASIEICNFEPYAHVIAIEKLIKPASGAQPDETMVKENLDVLSSKLDAYEVILSKQTYLAGDASCIPHLTLADLFHLPKGAMVTAAGINVLEDSNDRPNVARWWKALTSRSSWRAVKDGA